MYSMENWLLTLEYKHSFLSPDSPVESHKSSELRHSYMLSSVSYCHSFHPYVTQIPEIPQKACFSIFIVICSNGVLPLSQKKRCNSRCGQSQNNLSLTLMENSMNIYKTPNRYIYENIFHGKANEPYLLWWALIYFYINLVKLRIASFLRLRE